MLQTNLQLLPIIPGRVLQNESAANFQSLSVLPAKFPAEFLSEFLSKLPVKFLFEQLVIGLVDKGVLVLKIDDVLLRRADNNPELAVLFSGNFPDEIRGKYPTERSHHLNQLLHNWQPDLET